VSVGQLTFEWFRDDASAGLDAAPHRTTRRERLARHGRLDPGTGDGDA